MGQRGENGTTMSQEPPEKQTTGTEVDEAVAGPRMPSAPLSANASSADGNGEDEHEPDRYPPPEAACM
jgi:hypothetical protein